MGQSPLEKTGTWTIRSLTSVPNIIPTFIFVPVPPFQNADGLKEKMLRKCKIVDGVQPFGPEQHAPQSWVLYYKHVS